MPHSVEYTDNVTEFILSQVTSERVYNKIDSYRFVLADFPEIGTPYQPSYLAAQPAFPCRWIAVPDTPFTLYYLIESTTEKVIVFHIEHRARDPRKHFDWSATDL